MSAHVHAVSLVVYGFGDAAHGFGFLQNRDRIFFVFILREQFISGGQTCGAGADYIYFFHVIPHCFILFAAIITCLDGDVHGNVEK